MTAQVLTPRASRLSESYRNLTLWTLQGWLAMFFTAAGYAKLSEPMDNLVELMRWPAFAPENLVRGLGVAELALAALILAPLFSWRLGRLPMLTAAAGLALLEAAMLALHAVGLDWSLAATNLFLLAITVPVLIGRARERR